ncbi:MAG: ornithine--oxo-acid transaminase [Deltaproteobacteria bacterium]|nr:ornithine--oxo-acid transaminase [Deltaproteobacteria bacterium]
MNHFIEQEQQYCAHNYSPLPVVLTHGKGVYVWDDQDKRYMDMMSAYSAVSFGHSNPRILKALQTQAEKLGVVSRAFYTDQLGRFVAHTCKLTGMDMGLPMNTGAEAVETALKAARKWAYTIKGVEENKAEIIVCDGNFHGRTISIIAFSSEDQYRDGYGPFPPGFVRIPYANSQALLQTITPNTAAFLVEPIQGEGGILVPPKGYLENCAEICRSNNVLLFCDEIQTGLGRTGMLLASQHENVQPDGLMLGKALGGGLLPVSMFLARKDVMEVFKPGDHGSTFGGSPLAAAVGMEALNVLVEDGLIPHAAEMGEYLLQELQRIDSPLIISVRGKGLLTGLEIDTAQVSARDFCLALAENGILSKETHETVIRFAPPLIITRQQIDWAIEQITKTFDQFEYSTRRKVVKA